MTIDQPDTLAGGARAAVAALPGSKIREVANAAMGRDSVLAFWFGESDLPTPDFILRAGMRALESGRTFYTHNLGIPELREAIAAYASKLHDIAIAPARVAVTSSGVSGLMIAMQAILGPGDRVVAVTPVWPNLTAIPEILGAAVTSFALKAEEGAWHLDVDSLIAALTPDVRLLLINAPGNPTGWQITAPQQQRLLDHCRRRGIWIIADEVYERLTFAPHELVAPSFLKIAQPNDRLIAVNSFSKAWSMTGWRLGWLVVPPSLPPQLAKLIEFNSSCAAEFTQVAALTALRDGEPAVAAARARLIANRDLLIAGLRRLPGVQAPIPDGGMYAFFRLPQAQDSVAFAKRLVAEAGLGLAPGTAFGEAGEGWLRWCFAAEPAKIALGLERLKQFCGK